jgi:hypothetical protein
MNNNLRQLHFSDGKILEGINAVTSYDQITMKGRTKFLLKDTECPQITLTSPQAKIFSNFALIKKDLKFCKNALRIAIRLSSTENELKEVGGLRPEYDDQSDILKGMFISFVITYGKCFTKADGRRVKLETKNIFEGSGLKEMHLELMNLRHEYIAHGGNTKFEQVDPVIVLHPDKNLNTTPLLTTASYHVVGFNKEVFERYLVLVDYVDEQLNMALEKKAKALYEKEVASKELELLYEEAER